MYEKALLLNHYDTRRGITVQIYELARKRESKLISSLKKSAFWGKQAEIAAEILDKENLSKIEAMIIERLEKDNRLKEFFQDYRWFSRMDRELKDSLKDKGLYIRAGPSTTGNGPYIHLSCFYFWHRFSLSWGQSITSLYCWGWVLPP